MQMIYAFRSRELYPHHDGSAFPVELPPTEVRGEWLRQVKSIGFEGLELSLADLRERGAAEQDEIVRELADAGLPCVAIRGGGGMHHPRVAQQNRAALEAGVELAARIGAKVFNTLTNSPAVTGRPVLRCAPRAEVSCTIDGAECGRWSFRSECVPGAERWNGGTAEQWPDESE